VADAAALAGIRSQNPQAAANAYLTTQDWGGVSLSFPAPPNGRSFTVSATHDAPIILGGVAGIGSFNVDVHATAQMQGVSSVRNDRLTSVVADTGTMPPYVTPLVVNRCVVDGSCLAAGTTCFGASQPCDLNYDANDAAVSRLGIAQFDGTAFHDAIACDPVDHCLAATVSAGATPPQYTSGEVSNNDAVTALNQTPGRTLILPVFDGFSGGSYNIVGFAAFVVTTQSFDNTVGSGNWQPEPDATAPCRPRCKVIQGYFTDYTVPGSFTASTPTAPNYGVEAIGLTS
jgi:hypothetical protein